MGGLEFLATIIGHLAWPATVVVLIWLLVPRLPTISKVVKSFRFQGLEIDFQESVRELKQEAIESGVDVEAPEHQLPPLDKSRNLRLTLLEEWIAIESLLHRWSRIYDPGSDPRRSTALRTLSILVKKGLIDPSLLDLTYKIREIRNQIAHSPAVDASDEELLELVMIARAVRHQLDHKLDGA